MLVRKPIPGAPAAGLHFVENQQEAVLVGEAICSAGHLQHFGMWRAGLADLRQMHVVADIMRQVLDLGEGVAPASQVRRVCAQAGKVTDIGGVVGPAMQGGGHPPLGEVGYFPDVQRVATLRVFQVVDQAIYAVQYAARIAACDADSPCRLPAEAEGVHRQVRPGQSSAVFRARAIPVIPGMRQCLGRVHLQIYNLAGRGLADRWGRWAIRDGFAVNYRRGIAGAAEVIAQFPRRDALG